MTLSGVFLSHSGGEAPRLCVLGSVYLVPCIKMVVGDVARI